VKRGVCANHEIGPVNNRLVVTRIRVRDPRLRTKDGMGVGSTYRELRSRCSIDRVGPGEGAFFARADALGISAAQATQAGAEQP